MDPRILAQLTELGDRCKQLEDRLDVHVREIDNHETTLKTHQSLLLALSAKVHRLFAGCRRLQEGVLFVNGKACLLIRWALLQIKRRRGEAAQDGPEEQELIESQNGPSGYPAGLQLETENEPDQEAAPTAPSEAHLCTPSHKRPRASDESRTRIWTARSVEASGHSAGGESDTD